MMTLNNNAYNLKVSEIIGGGYNDFWKFKGRYRVVKGSRASKKSKTTVINFITRLMQYPQANLLVVRKTYRTLKDSCYSDLKWAIHKLKVDDYWECTLNPLEITYKPTGQKILFRGLDDPLKVTSISVTTGVLCWLWIEEAYEITSEDDFNMLDESIRGQVPEGLFKQITLTLNPWNDKHWIKRRFFDTKSDNILAKTTNYLCNEFLDDADIQVFEDMKKNNPRRYKVAGLGEWGAVDGLIYENWEEREFDYKELAKKPQFISVFGLDFGYTNDPTAFICCLINDKDKELYVFDEIYQRGMLNTDIYNAISEKGYVKERITADSAEPKSIDELKLLGLRRIKPALKGKDSINNGIQFIQQYKIIINPKCVNFITEIQNYMWDKDKFDNKLNKPIDDFNHLMDALRYAMEDLKKADTVNFGYNKIM